MGPRPRLGYTPRARLFMRRLGPWMDNAVDRILGHLEADGAKFVTAGELEASV